MRLVSVLPVILILSATANGATIQFSADLEPAAGAPAYASTLSGSIDAVWDVDNDSFVTFDMVITGLPNSLQWNDYHLFIEAYGPGGVRYSMPIVQISLSDNCCGPHFDSTSGILYFDFDGYVLSRDLPPNDFVELFTTQAALDQGWVNFTLINNFTAVGAAGFPDYGVPLLTASFSSAVPIPAAVWLFGSALGLLGWARRSAA